MIRRTEVLNQITSLLRSYYPQTLELVGEKASTHGLVLFLPVVVGMSIRSHVPRNMRVEYPGAMDPVRSRGDRREGLFLDDVDRQDFLKKPHLWMKANAEPAVAQDRTGEGKGSRNVKMA